ncbi:MAG: helicase-associated domain-containing protein [Planctomycetota bacterium]
MVARLQPARNRYLLDLDQDDAPAHRAPLTISHAALTELGRAAQDRLTRDLFSLGLVDVALSGTEPVGVRLSRLGHRLLLDEPTRAPTNPPLVVNPDFELLVLPEGDVDELLHALDRIAVRERTGEVVHYRLDRERIERVAAEGEAADDTIDFLAAHCRAELPQNVVYSIRSWSGNVRLATLERGVLFVANDPTVVEAICNHSALKDCVERVINPTTLFFNGKVMERQIAQELRSLGIHVR